MQTLYAAESYCIQYFSKTFYLALGVRTVNDLLVPGQIITYMRWSQTFGRHRYIFSVKNQLRVRRGVGYAHFNRSVLQ